MPDSVWKLRSSGLFVARRESWVPGGFVTNPGLTSGATNRPPRRGCNECLSLGDCERRNFLHEQRLPVDLGPTNAVRMNIDWRRPIIFEGTELPDVTIAIDHLGMHDNLPGISEETSEWLWHFTVCVGRKKTDDSATVLLRATEALNLAKQHRDNLKQTVPKHFQGPLEPEVIDDWIAALETIVGIASTCESCSWEAPLRPGDKNYGRPLEEVREEMLKRADLGFERHNNRPWWKRLFSG